jgi:MazG family protein
MPARDLESLVALVARLRAPDGCPWDREQTHESLTGLLVEEAYEVVGAIEAGDPDALKEELGDLLLHMAFHVQIARERGEFDLEDVLTAVREKIVRRHPHVFGEERDFGIAEVRANWERLKQTEHGSKSVARSGALPALVAARKALDRAANLGLDMRELLPEPPAPAASLVGDADEESLGALLLTIVALACARGLEPEIALKRATARLSQQLERNLDADVDDDAGDG